MRRPSSLRERAAQLLFIRIGSNMNPPIRAHEEANRVAALVERCPVGGLLLFNGKFKETGQALQGLQKISKYPLLVAADLERGAGQQLEGATIFPHAMALSAQTELAVSDAYDMGRITAREALSEGVHYILGPVADLNRNPRNPIIGTRSFGRDPQRVAKLVCAYVKGCRSEGCVVAPKHFPGHGNTDADSHSDVPVIDGSCEEFEEIDLVPFREAISAGCETVMTAHAVYPGLDPSGRVATRSRAIMNDLLRETLGFDGAVVSDSLLMDGIRRSYSGTGEMAVDLLRSGLDILLDIDDAEEAVESIVQAVGNGELKEESVNRAFGHGWGLKERLEGTFGQHWHTRPPAHPTAAEMAEHAVAAARIARKALVSAATTGTYGGKRALFVLVKPYRTHLESEVEPFGRLIAEGYGSEAYYQIDEGVSDDLLHEIEARVGDVERLVVAVVARPAAWRSTGVSDRLAKYVGRILESADNPLLLVLGAPEAVPNIPYAGPRLVTFSDVEASQAAAFEWLTGYSLST